MWTKDDDEVKRRRRRRRGPSPQPRLDPAWPPRALGADLKRCLRCQHCCTRYLVSTRSACLSLDLLFDQHTLAPIPACSPVPHGPRPALHTRSLACVDSRPCRLPFGGAQTTYPSSDGKVKKKVRWALAGPLAAAPAPPLHVHRARAHREPVSARAQLRCGHLHAGHHHIPLRGDRRAATRRGAAALGRRAVGPIQAGQWVAREPPARPERACVTTFLYACLSLSRVITALGRG